MPTPTTTSPGGKQPAANPPAPAPGTPGEEGGISTRTRQKAEASKSFLEQHYMSMLRSMSSGQEARPVNQPRQKELEASDFEELKLIGRGAFGEVFICKKKDDEDPNKLYAMKRMMKAEMLKKRKVAHVRSENNILAQAAQGSPWIVTLHYSFQDEKYLYMIMDYMPGGDIMTWLCNEGIFSIEATRFYVAELALAVYSVHEREYVHRDIKPDNILMDAEGHTKLSDFGLCKAFPKDERHILDLYSALQQEQEAAAASPKSPTKSGSRGSVGFRESEPFVPPPPPPSTSLIATSSSSEHIPPPASGDVTPPQGSTPSRTKEGEYSPVGGTKEHTPTERRVHFNSIVGSPGYIAPEILMRHPYTTACDWWSVGVIMYEMLYGRTPFYSPDPQKTGYMITHWSEYLRFPSGRGVPDTAVDLMKRLLCGQDNRISFQDLKSHPFFEGVDWENQQHSPAVFQPTLADPLDVRYFPPHEELARPHAPDPGLDGLRQEDPRGVLFADFRYDKRRDASLRSTSSTSA